MLLDPQRWWNKPHAVESGVTQMATTSSTDSDYRVGFRLLPQLDIYSHRVRINGYN